MPPAQRSKGDAQEPMLGRISSDVPRGRATGSGPEWREDCLPGLHAVVLLLTQTVRFPHTHSVNRGCVMDLFLKKQPHHKGPLAQFVIRAIGEDGFSLIFSPCEESSTLEKRRGRPVLWFVFCDGLRPLLAVTEAEDGPGRDRGGDGVLAPRCPERVVAEG